MCLHCYIVNWNEIIPMDEIHNSKPFFYYLATKVNCAKQSKIHPKKYTNKN